MDTKRIHEIHFVIPVDPLRLRINIQMKFSQYVPEDVKKAMAEIRAKAEEVCLYHAWEVDPVAEVGVDLSFYFESRRPDLDGPLKRTLDGLVKGMGFDDNRVDELYLHRWVGLPSIGVKVWELPTNRDPNAAKVKRKTSLPVWQRMPIGTVGLAGSG